MFELRLQFCRCSLPLHETELPFELQMLNVYNLEDIAIYLVTHRLYADDAHRVGMLHIVLDALGGSEIHLNVQVGERYMLCEQYLL